jgi:MATE family multidrug resistance protein
MSSQLSSLQSVNTPALRRDILKSASTRATAGQLTRFPVGSIAELWTLAYPLMISLLSVGVMIFADRFFLAKLSLDAFNAASEAAVFFMAVEFSIVSLVGVAEVLVGKACGAHNFPKVAKAVWSMIWLSLMSSVIFFPVAFFAVDLLFNGSPNKALAIEYFVSLSYFGPIFPLNCALASFWIGQGRTRLVTFCNIGASLLNIGLDVALIFGFAFFPALGITGAGIATGISQLVMSLVYFIVFLQPKNRKKYDTANWYFDWQSFKEAILLGFPQSLSLLAQCAAWACFFRIMALASAEHLLVSGISQAIFYLFGFVVEGVSKASSTIVANLIGAKRHDEIALVCRRGVYLHLIFSVIMGLVFLLFPETILRMFLPIDSIIPADTWRVLEYSLCWIWLMLIGEALLFLWNGVLVAFGDTRFILFTSSILIWVFGVGPAYLATLKWHQGPHIASAVACFYYVIAGIAYFWRVHYKLRHRQSQKSVPET